MAWAVVTCPAVSGRSSWARQSADSASIFEVSPYPGSPPETSVTTRRPPPLPTKRTRNQLFSRCSADGPSPESILPSSQLRVGGSWASANRPARPPVAPMATGSRLTAAKWP